MADTTYVDGSTVIAAEWLNDLNRLHYTIFGDPAAAGPLSITLNSAEQVRITGTASASRYITLTGSNGGAPVIGTSAGDLRMSPAATLLLGKAASDGVTAGIELGVSGGANFIRSAAIPIVADRLTDDGTLVSLRQDTNEEGTISVSGTTVSYNAFLGSHWSQFEDGSKPDILRGTLMETIDMMCEWPGEENEKLPRCKVSDTPASPRIYGVFLAWDNDDRRTNDMYVAAVGSFLVRVNKDVVVMNGDLLESNGDGTARVQADYIVRASTVAKVIAAVKQDTYDDGSYTVPCVFFNG